MEIRVKIKMKMKKTYIEPQTQEIRLNISNMICTSGLGIASETTSEANVTDADSRSFQKDFWDDEDEDY